jgi:Flp pilus assembly protein TadG
MNHPEKLLRFTRDQRGVAAIEMALIFPVLLILFVGLIDLTALLSDNRRVAYSANVVGDVVTRLQGSTTPQHVGDSFEAAELVMSAARAGPARVEIYTYRRENDGSTLLRWKHDNGAGAACGEPDRGNLADLMDKGNDVVVAVVCVVHTPVVTNILGWTPMGAASFRLRQQIAMRPRHSLVLECPPC